MTKKPIHVTDTDFEICILKNPLPAIVEFWAPWCNPCKMIAPVMDKLANEYDGELVIAKVNTDEHSEWMTKYGVQGIPTLLFISEGKVIHRQVGALPERMLRDVITQFTEITGMNLELVISQSKQ